MRSVWTGILCAGLIAGCGTAAAAQGVKIWVPTPVRVVAHEAPAAKVQVKVVTVVVSTSARRNTSRDWSLGSGAFGYTKVYSGPRYPF